MSRLAALALFVREDVLDTRRERQLYLLVGIYVLVGVLLTYSEGQSPGVRNADPELAPALFVTYTMLTPLLALGFFASTVVEKRADGALKVVLGLPIDRGAVVVGTFLARSLVACGAVVASMLAAVPVGLLVGVRVDLVQFVGVAAALSLLTVTFTAFAVGLSSIVRTSTRATVAAFGVYLLFFLRLWDRLPRIVLYVRHGFSTPEATPDWVHLVESLNPIVAYAHLSNGLFPDLEGGTLVQPPEAPAFYQEPPFALVVLTGWIVLAIGVGYWRFRATDL